MCRSGPAGERLEEQFGAPPTAFEELLADRRQPDVRGDLDVVEPDHRELLRHVDPQTARSFEMKLNDTSRYLNLGDWIKYDSYAVFDANDMVLKYYSTK